MKSGIKIFTVEEIFSYGFEHTKIEILNALF